MYGGGWGKGREEVEPCGSRNLPLHFVKLNKEAPVHFTHIQQNEQTRIIYKSDATLVQTGVQRLTGLADKNQESPNDLMGRCFKLEFIGL